MLRNEFDVLEQQTVSAVAPIGRIYFDGEDRTLLWGYDVDRRSWHVFVLNGIVFRACYGVNAAGESSWNLRLFFDYYSDLVPNKWLYPEACDFEFCVKLKGTGLNLPFTAWNDERKPKQFHGLISVTDFHAGVENPCVFDYVDFGDIARGQLNQQCQYASRYIGGKHGRPDLGAGLRFRHLDTGSYHDIQIHHADVGEFVRRVHAHRAENDHDC